jgi:hypothetical protein
MSIELTPEEYDAKSSEVVVKISERFLRQRLPDDWHEWENEVIDRFLLEEALPPFRYANADDMYELITGVGLDIMNILGFKDASIDYEELRKIEERTNELYG